MRHRKGFNHLSRKAPHRKAMLANMASSLIKHKRITTTQAKAKALRQYVEPLITKSKEDTTHSRRVVFSYLQDKDAVTELFREVSPKVLERAGGYTRILKMDNRPGDNAEMALIELVDFNENLISESKPKSSGSRRRRRGGSSKKQETPEASVDVAETETAGKEAETPSEPDNKEATEKTEDSAVETKEAQKPEEKKTEEEKPAEEVTEVKAEEATEVKAEEAKEETKAEEKKEEPESGKENNEEKKDS